MPKKLDRELPIKPFVRPGRQLGFVEELQARGLWPPRLHDRTRDNWERPKATTPYLFIPASSTDDGLRPQPNSTAFHSEGVWLVDGTGPVETAPVVSEPVVNGQYRIRCKVRNIGAFPAYGAMANFFVNQPAAFNAAVGSGNSLPAIGHTGFVVKQGQEIVITCPKPWIPATPADLSSTIVVHAYDPFADNIISRFDARNDRHVARHDLAPDLYVRDWTDSSSVHDLGQEPSARTLFYTNSDVWNRRSASPGGFISDQPWSEDVQAGIDAAGDNFIFARISRNKASSTQKVKAHFLFAEFGTGSPFVDCSPGPDPEVTLLPGETTKIISQPWHLHPSNSPHLCIAVQIYSDADPYAPPSLLGYSPGWPTTDTMIINDNNKAQRNIRVWDGVPDAGGFHLSIIFNASTSPRDVVLAIGIPQGARRRIGGAPLTEGVQQSFRNAKVMLPGTGVTQDLRAGSNVVLKNLLPGERRWLAFSHDGFAVQPNEVLTLNFSETVDNKIVNGFAFGFRNATAEGMLPGLLSLQKAVLHRMSVGLGIAAARDGLADSQRRQQSVVNVQTVAKSLPAMATVLTKSLGEMWAKFQGAKDILGVTEDLQKLGQTSADDPVQLLALHCKVLHKIDALQTMAVKSKGDLADVLFTVRLQRDVCNSAPLVSSPSLVELRKKTDEFIAGYQTNTAVRDSYVPFVKSLTQFFRTAIPKSGGVAQARFSDLNASFERSPEEVQKAHLAFLNALLLTFSKRAN